MAELNQIGPQTKAPEVYRNTPFEYVLTAEPRQLVEIHTQLIPSNAAWVAVMVPLERKPPLPQWMTTPQTKLY